MTIIKQNLSDGEKLTTIRRVLKINRSTYYKWLHFTPYAYQLTTQRLKQVIKKLHDEILIYEEPRLTTWLSNQPTPSWC